MSVVSIFSLNGTVTEPPRDWEKMSVIATFDGGNPQPRITTTDLEFVNENAQIIREWIEGGNTGATPGIFEGIPFTWQITSSAGVSIIHRGYVDTVNGFKVNSPVSVSAKIERDGSIVSIQERLRAITFQTLWDEGSITSSDILDIPYLIEPKKSFIEVAMTTISVYLMIEKIVNESRELGKTIANIAAHIAGGATGGLAALAYSIAVALLQVTYIVAMIIAVINLITQLLTLLISPVKFHTGVKMKTLISAAFSKIGYNFNTSITEYNDLTYIPSKNSINLNNQYAQIVAALTINQPGIGIPGSKDYGYTGFEAVKLMNDCFYAKIAVINGEIEQHSLINTFWDRNSTYVLPDVLDEETEYNAPEIAARRLITFRTDPTDVFTLENFKGTTFEVVTEEITSNFKKNVLLKGIDDVQLPVALASRKNELNPVENSLKGLAQAADKLINFFGGSSSLASKITARIGMIKLENDMFEVAKLVRLNSSKKLNANHRDFWSAKYLENNYHVKKSFVRNSYINQYRLVTEKRIPFNHQNYLELLENNRLTTQDGDKGEVDEFKWTMDKYFAVTSYRVYKPYTKNLKERFIEPS